MKKTFSDLFSFIYDLNSYYTFYKNRDVADIRILVRFNIRVYISAYSHIKRSH